MLVSVVIPAYNAAEFIRETVESVLASTHAELEVIVVDDGSTDATGSISRSVADARVSVLTFENGGTSTARNRGLAHACGDVVAFLDADDLWDPEKLSRQLPILADPGVVGVGCRMRYVSASGRVAGVAGEDPDTPIAREMIEGAWLMPFPISVMIFRTEAARSIGGFDQRYFPADDLDFLCRVAVLGRVTWTPEILGSYRVHGSSASDVHAFDQHAKAGFLRRRQAARAAGSDLSYEDFQAEPGISPHEQQRVRAIIGFRAAGVAVMSGHYLQGAAQMVRALRQDPRYCFERATFRARLVLETRRARRGSVDSK